jgi:hypothetical protein
MSVDIYQWKACQASLRVFFAPAMQMLNQLVASQADHSLVHKQRIYADPALWVGDELGINDIIFAPEQATR